MTTDWNQVVLVIDLSRGEYIPGTPGKVDFRKMKAAGVGACYFRATDGQAPDKTYPVFVADCDGLLPWGAFGTIYPASPDGIKAQARAFVMAAGPGRPGQLPIAIDWEVEGVTWQMVYQYIVILQAAYPGVEIIIYSRAEILKRLLPNRILQAASYKWFTQFQIWQAQYQTSQPSALPNGFTLFMWQWTKNNKASLFGIVQAQSVDSSWFPGTPAQFAARCSLVPATPPDPDPAPDPEPGPTAPPVFVVETLEQLTHDVAEIKARLQAAGIE